ncbi:MAG: pknK [Frankiales bacterium]|nr:pknK [Frankiales bacterium]
MDGVTARSRLRPPTLPARFTHRRRLSVQLDSFDWLPLTLVCAGAGSGKTTLLADWASTLPRRPAWISLSPGEDAPQTFWDRVGAALESAGHLVDRNAYAALPHDRGPAAFLAGLRRVLPAQRTVLILDDAQHLIDPSLLAELDAVVRAGGDRLRLIVSARLDPVLALHSYRSAGLLGEIRATELAMTPQESRRVLASHSVALTDGQLATLQRRTEGWVAGVRLSAMGAAGLADPADFIQQFALDRGSVGEYLVAEVLARLSPAERRLLIATSFLDEVAGPIAEAVAEVPGAVELLRGLARANSFVTPVNDAQLRFRYHPLLREILLHFLQHDGEFSATRLYQRASEWCLAAEDPLRALEYARLGHNRRQLRAALLGGSLAATLIELGTLNTIDDEVLATVADPDPALGGEDLAAQHATALIAVVRAGEQYSVVEVDRAVRRLAVTPSPRAGPHSALALRSAVLEIQARVHFWSSGDWRFPSELLSEAARSARLVGSVPRAELRCLALLELVNAVRPQGGDASARRRSRALVRADPELTLSATYHLAEVVRAFVRLDLPRWRSCLDLAETRWRQSKSDRGDPAIGWALIMLRSWLSFESGDAASARTELLALERAVPRLPPLLLAARLHLLAEIETELGRPQSALNLLGARSADQSQPWLAIAAARAYLSQERTAPADRLLRFTLADDSASDDPILVSALLLSARSRQLQGADDSAEWQVRQALELAGDDIRQPFVRARGMLAGLLEGSPRLLRAWPADPRVERRPLGPAALVVGPELLASLSGREIAILHRLGARMTNAEIARELLLSPNTVKSHLTALYQKLGAANRSEAVATARQHGLL